MCQKQFHATPAHVYQNYQAMIRLSVKLRFLIGIAHRIAETNGIIGFPQVREMLGQLAAEVSHGRGLRGRRWRPRARSAAPISCRTAQMLYAAQVLTQQLYAKIINTLRELAGGGMIMLPSSVKDFDNPELARLIGKTQQSPAASAVDKVKFYKLAWDAVGSEFASRHSQYEMFYAGATFVTKGHAFRTYDWQKAAALLDKMLSSYDLADELTTSISRPLRPAPSLNRPFRKTDNGHQQASRRISHRRHDHGLGDARRAIRPASSRRSCRARSTKRTSAAAAPVCCASSRAFTRPSPSCTNIGKKCFCSPAI